MLHVQQKSWHQLVLKNGFDTNAVLASWQWWIFKELPFSYVVNELCFYIAYLHI